MGTKTDSSNKPYSGRKNPPLIQPNGNVATWKNSVLRGSYSYADGDSKGDYEFDVTLAQHVLLFCQDVPLLFYNISYYTAATVPSALPPLTFLETTIQEDYNNGRIFAAGDDVLITPGQDDPIGRGNASYGTTLTNGVAVSGRYICPRISDRGLEDGDGVIDPFLRFMAICASPVMEGEGLWSIEADDPVTFAGLEIHDQILLYEPDYTQAIKDNGNIWEPVGLPGSYYHVVGIFNEYAGPF